MMHESLCSVFTANGFTLLLFCDLLTLYSLHSSRGHAVLSRADVPGAAGDVCVDKSSQNSLFQPTLKGMDESVLGGGIVA